MSLSAWMLKLIAVVTLSVVLGTISVALALRSGKSMPAALLVGLSVGTAALGGFSAIF
ncbi:hypothetical protein [Planotetraspora sp. GP83]|uniref:hypothetical protein n=1 Tax=Planotetraspora sp. GP83 TaxID=3156264 RepID=UPI003519BDE6